MTHPSTSSLIEFYSYGDSLPGDCINNVFNHALSEALAHPHNQLIDSERMDFWGIPAQLILYPGELMTWIMWVRALWLMKDFVFRKGMGFEWQYLVLEPALADVGKGTLVNG